MLAAEPVVETWGTPLRGLQRLRASLRGLQRGLLSLLLHPWRKIPKVAELESSFLGPFDPETESLEEYDARLDQGVEMARPDCKNEAISLAGCCLGSAVPDSLFAIYNSVPLNTSSCTPGRP